MNTNDFPPLFVSHGAPDLVLHDTEANRFLRQWGRSAQLPRAILIISAHFETDQPSVSFGDAPGMIYDFGGFDPKLRTLVYPAPGNDALAHRARDLLRQVGFDVSEVTRGFDHGTWVPLMLLFPQANIPVVQLSVQPEKCPEHHFRIGQALQPLREDGVVIIGSGSFTHNLSAVFGANGLADRNAKAPKWVTEFSDWMDERLTSGAVDDLLNYRTLAPFAERNHPTDEHLLPLYVVLGAAGGDAVAERVHHSHEFGALMMDAYAFGNGGDSALLAKSA